MALNSGLDFLPRRHKVFGNEVHCLPLRSIPRPALLERSTVTENCLEGKQVTGGKCPTLRDTSIHQMEVALNRTTFLAQAQALLDKAIGEQLIILTSYFPCLTK